MITAVTFDRNFLCFPHKYFYQLQKYQSGGNDKEMIDLVDERAHSEVDNVQRRS